MSYVTVLDYAALPTTTTELVVVDWAALCDRHK
jgi:hypothetical protein